MKNKLKKIYWVMVITGIPITILQLVSIILGFTHGLWWLLGVWALVAVPWGIVVSVYYYNHVAYICPKCNEVFKPRFKEMFWACHTPKTRRLTCIRCGTKDFCVEVYAENNKK